jgi:hypothetical protein
MNVVRWIPGSKLRAASFVFGVFEAERARSRGAQYDGNHTTVTFLQLLFSALEVLMHDADVSERFLKRRLINVAAHL